MARSPVSERVLARLFIAPSLLTLMLVALFPVTYALWLSLFGHAGRFREGFAGLDNYTQALGSSAFWDAVRATAVFTVTSVTAEFVLGLGFALVMNRAMRARGITRAVILIPWVIPTVIAGQMWFFMFNVTPGFINSVLSIGDFNWLGEAGWAMFTVVFADVWKTTPFVALLLLAGLQTIPNDIYESGDIDGANRFQRFRYLTLPLLRPAILVALLFRTIDALRVFDLPQVMTRGAFGTETLSMIVHRYVVRTPDPGYGAALSTLVFLLLIGTGVFFVAALGRQLSLEADNEVSR